MSTKPTKIRYTAEASVTGGRAGHAETSDGTVKVDLSPPAEMGGDGSGTNPEQLFAAGYAACFQGALGAVARKAGVDVSDSTVTGKVGIGPNDAGGFGLAVELVVSVPGADTDTVRALTDEAHQVCPYSNATRGNIDVTLRVA